MQPENEEASPVKERASGTASTATVDPGRFSHRPSIEIDALELRAVRRRFFALNKDRLHRVQKALQPRQRVFIELLPLLFHINHPMLPGYLASDTACGISGYSPGKRCIKTAKKLARSFKYLRRAQQVYAIHAIYLMGSTGTIAYSGQSDFDIWICHRPGISPEEQAQLSTRADSIRDWAESLGLEVHFFIMDDVSFRQGQLDALSSESVGSSQHHLLLDEFYRTGLLVAGRFPAWWLVPPGYESCYREYVRKLLVNRFIKGGDIIDFGGLNEIPVEEFYGATLWQLYKAIDSPYKSILKLLLLEAYARQYPRIEVLSMRFKQAVYSGDCKLNDIDPYVMMCNAVEEYLFNNRELDRLELARRCFYFKVDEPASRPAIDNDNQWRRTLLRQLTDSWGWGEQQLTELDQRKRWKIFRVMEERELLVNELTRSYRELSAFVRENNNPAAITQSELNLLGRKLFVAFERKPGKIDSINPGISRDLSERHLSLWKSGTQDHMSWQLYRDNVTSLPSDNPVLKQTANILQLLAWCHVNGLINQQPGTIHLHPPDSTFDQWELRCLLDVLQELFPRHTPTASSLQTLNEPARLVRVGVFINIAIDPMEKLTRQGMQLVSDRIDPFSYGQQAANLVIRIDTLASSSWNETLTFEYQQQCAVLDCLCDLLAWSPMGETTPPQMPCYSFSTSRGQLIARRVEELYRDVIGFFYHARNPLGRYVVGIGQAFYVLQPENGVPRYTALETSASLIDHLGQPQAGFSPIRFDTMTLADTPLAEIIRYNKPGLVQLFFQIAEGSAYIYILDEQGSLFFQQQQFYDQHTLLNPYRHFFDSVQQRLAQFGNIAVGRAEAVFYQLIHDELDRLQVRQLSLSSSGMENYLGLQVIGNPDENPCHGLTIYCNNREFSSLELGDRLFQTVAAEVIRLRDSGAHYPVYITDIDISHGHGRAGEQAGLQTTHYLRMKHQVEQQLNTALAGIESWRAQSILAGSVTPGKDRSGDSG